MIDDLRQLQFESPINSSLEALEDCMITKSVPSEEITSTLVITLGLTEV